MVTIDIYPQTLTVAGASLGVLYMPDDGLLAWSFYIGIPIRDGNRRLRNVASQVQHE